MALSTARIHRVRGRPPLLAAGIRSLIHPHSSSFRSLGYIFSLMYPFYTTHKDFSDKLSERATPMPNIYVLELVVIVDSYRATRIAVELYATLCDVACDGQG